MKNTCKSCGESFKISKEDAQLVENGEITKPELCDECSDMQYDQEPDIYDYSDADPGL